MEKMCSDRLHFYKSGTARFNSRNKEYDAKLFFMLLQEYVL